MTLLISSGGPGSTGPLKLDGRLTAEEVVELRHACAGVQGQVVLDLTDLQFADRQGVSVLREFKAHGAQFVGVSQYLGLLLGETRNDCS